MKLTVTGTGYLGATHAICMAELGHEVLGVDISAERIAALNEGRVPFHEPGLADALTRSLATGRLSFTTDIAAAADFADTHFLTVGTPQHSEGRSADLSQVHGAVTALARHLHGRHLIIGKSTVPVGTAADLRRMLNQLTGPDTTVDIAWNPEFLREGHAVRDTLHPDRIVLGVAPGSTAESTVRDIYARTLADDGTPFLVTDLETAELVKGAANAFLATKISFINAIAEVCERSGADVTQLADALGHDTRIGRRFLGAGLGFGGGCLPKDIRAFASRAEQLGATGIPGLLGHVDEINLRQRRSVIDTVTDSFDGDVTGRRVSVLGVAFKPDSDDIRDSPALAIAGSLSRSGAQVTVHDPEAMGPASRILPELGYAPTPLDALRGAEVVVLATEWRDFIDLDPVAARDVVDRPFIIDGRNCLPVEAWIGAGWDYRGMGRRF
ncbi:UDP-glucose dehydrogenase family protein [Corynebacterium pygosceleis]|uniref:UDP-glucose 6-dehydrogenase n=1 Tax=Corynebacterium pygosceleis TaxID=2800406 RepID=A0A9Q4CBI6_9CORY|nr:UDP-glucose/GDP-mannose dehydrogenase family protein [Corynebacterium pygosceleis]MCK7638297.1 UDP-glucose/GDP-mannose dehydrogenase family protein [Corynebacterium pygosceleis]MCL0121329.1 UDP-glucose/GDP-mannose dehydrogenase family protein [Corynebacterium pygosceleis]MCX7445658.1 UDP-glucose/GDP-mannose dehydrogenase family protein [Corynebacterium pygosceleis]MCX7468960.1 UDP-glucose/GDP-mannose dehydrogenase family protein [Corynebacterium pygosceleis]